MIIQGEDTAWNFLTHNNNDNNNNNNNNNNNINLCQEKVHLQVFLKCVAHMFSFRGWVARPLHMWVPYTNLL